MKPETKKAAKARIIAEKIAAKEAFKEARRAKVFSTPVAIAVEPLRVDAMQEAKTEALSDIKKILDQIEKILGKHSDIFDINQVAPRPEWPNKDKMEYEARCQWRMDVSMVSSVIDKDKYYTDKKPRPVKIDEDKIAQYVLREQQLAADQYEGFVYKLVEKIGDHASAGLVPMQGVWTHSILTVTKKDGTSQQWETKRIINRSCLGKLFFQWPTRLMK